MIKFTEGGLIDIWPEKDPEIQALSYALQQQFKKLKAYVDRTQCYSDVDDLDEDVLDYFAVEMRSMYYDQDLELEKKREIVKNTLRWHTHAGTVSAIKELISVIFREGTIKEWFEFEDGEALPGEFDILIKTQINEKIYKQFNTIIEKAKNVRSHLRHVSISYESKSTFYIGNMVKETKTIKPANIIVVNPLDNFCWYINEKSETLTDEFGNVLEA